MGITYPQEPRPYLASWKVVPLDLKYIHRVCSFMRILSPYWEAVDKLSTSRNVAFKADEGEKKPGKEGPIWRVIHLSTRPTTATILYIF